MPKMTTSIIGTLSASGFSKRCTNSAPEARFWIKFSRTSLAFERGLVSGTWRSSTRVTTTLRHGISMRDRVSKNNLGVVPPDTARQAFPFAATWWASALATSDAKADARLPRLSNNRSFAIIRLHPRTTCGHLVRLEQWQQMVPTFQTYRTWVARRILSNNSEWGQSNSTLRSPHRAA